MKLDKSNLSPEQYSKIIDLVKKSDFISTGDDTTSKIKDIINSADLTYEETVSRLEELIAEIQNTDQEAKAKLETYERITALGATYVLSWQL